MKIYLPLQTEKDLRERWGPLGLQQMVTKALVSIRKNAKLADALMYADDWEHYEYPHHEETQRLKRENRRLKKEAKTAGNRAEWFGEELQAKTDQIEHQRQQIFDLKSQLEAAQERFAKLEAAQEARELNPRPPLPAVEPKVIERVVEKRVEVPVEVEKVVERPFDQKTFELAVDYAASERMRLACDEDNLMAAIRKVACREFLLPQPGARSRFIELLFGMRKEAQHEVVDKIVCEAMNGVRG